MIAVATEDFEVYHGVVNELRDRGATFTTIEPDEALPEGTDVLITGAKEEPEVPVPVVHADPEHPRKAVEAALGHLRGEHEQMVVGVDPGDQPGIAVLRGETVVAAFQVPATEAAQFVMDEVEGEGDAVVRIGHGARLTGARIIEEIEDVRVELVDETGTTPYLGTGARGMGDVLAAVNIARLEGDPVTTRDIEPTPGELRVIKQRSREVSSENREIDDALAREVAVGDLSVEEALEEHRER